MNYLRHKIIVFLIFLLLFSTITMPLLCGNEMISSKIVNIKNNNIKDHFIGKWEWNSEEQTGYWIFFKNNSLKTTYIGSAGATVIYWWHFQISNDSYICFNELHVGNGPNPPPETICYTYVFNEDYTQLTVTYDNISYVWHKIADILYVNGNDETGENYTSITDAITHANNKDIIVVHNGTYTESLIINKYLTCIGENKQSTCIIGTNQSSIQVTATGSIELSGFTIETVNSSSNQTKGIYLQSNENSIKNNIIKNNNIGIYSTQTDNNQITNNIIYNNEEYGIYLSNSDNNLCSNNYFHSNNIGFRLKGSKSNTITKNSFYDNIRGLYLCCGSRTNTIYNNNFLNHEQWHAYDTDDNQWDDGGINGGNYWDDYNGSDSNNDGYGDEPYVLHSGGSMDTFPLIKPYDEKPIDVIIIKPQNAIYINNEKIMNFYTPIIFGEIDISGRFYNCSFMNIFLYINDEEFKGDSAGGGGEGSNYFSAQWCWDEQEFGKCNIKIIAYDTIGYNITKEINVRKYF